MIRRSAFDPFEQSDQGGDNFVEGYYLRERRDCVSMPVRVWFGPPLDPVTGEELDRTWRWQVMEAGQLVEEIEQIARIWPKVMRAPTTKQEYEYRLARIEWARENDPSDPFGAVYGKIDLRTAPLPFGD